MNNTGKNIFYGALISDKFIILLEKQNVDKTKGSCISG
jgi:hypothetical protein